MGLHRQNSAAKIRRKNSPQKFAAKIRRKNSPQKSAAKFRRQNSAAKKKYYKYCAINILYRHEKVTQETRMEKIILHKAKLIVDWNGQIFKPEILNELAIDSVVRLSMVMPDPPSNLWSHDSPYVSIVEIKDTKKNSAVKSCDFEQKDAGPKPDAKSSEPQKSENYEKYLGEVLYDGREQECNRYPVASGDRIWFSPENIIEIPLKEQSKNKAKKMKTYLTAEKVSITGPLYTIIEDHLFDREDSDDNSYDSYSDRE